MSLLVCRTCTTRYAANLTACPHCGNDAARFAVPETGAQEKPKATRSKAKEK